MYLYEIKLCDLYPTVKVNFFHYVAWHSSLLDAKYAPSLVFLYDLSGIEKTEGLATGKKRFLSEFTDGALDT